MESETKPSLRERKKDRLRDTILEEGVRLFRAKGYSHTTLKEIADAAETSVATLVRYYPSKEQILLGGEYRVLDEMEARTHARRYPTMAAGLADVISMASDNINQRASMLAIALADPDATQILARLRGRYNAVLEGYFASYLPKTRAGRFRAKVLGAMLSAIAFAGMEFWNEHGQGADLAAMQREVMAEFTAAFVTAYGESAGKKAKAK